MTTTSTVHTYTRPPFGAAPCRTRRARARWRKRVNRALRRRDACPDVGPHERVALRADVHRLVLLEGDAVARDWAHAWGRR